MRGKIIFIILLSACLISCQSKQAFDYSEKIVSIEKSMAPVIDSSGPDIFRLMEEQQFDSVAVLSLRMESFVDSKISEINLLQVPDAKKADHFKKTALRYFGHVKNLFAGYKKYGSATDKDKRELARKEMLETEQQTSSVVEEMKKAQKEFASANGFRIE